MRESINDVDDDKDYLYGTLVVVTISSGMDLYTTQNRMGCEVIKGCRYNQPQSSVLASYTACNSLSITHLPPCLQRDGDPGRNSKPLLSRQQGCNKAVAVLPWKPWRNLEPSGSSSGVYSLYPPKKSWLKTLRPTRGPGEDPVLLRCPSTWERHSKMSILKLESYICGRLCGSTVSLKICQSW